MQRLLLFFTLFLAAVVAKAAMPPGDDFSASLVKSDGGKTATLTFTGGGPAEMKNWLKDDDNRAQLIGKGIEKLVVVCDHDLELQFLEGGEVTEGQETLNLSELDIPYLDLSQATFGWHEQDPEKNIITNPNVKGVKLGDNNPTASIDAANYDDLVVARNNQVTAKCTNDGNLADFMEAFSDESFSKLTITGTLGSEDAGALNATAVDVSAATVTANKSDIQGTAQYLSLPSGFDNNDLEALQTQNPNLKVAMAFSNMNTSLPKVTMHSFASNGNEVPLAISALGNQANVSACKSVAMSGTYGVNDLAVGNSQNFGSSPDYVAEWDFTGATFTTCTIDLSKEITDVYYASNDPFQLNGPVTMPSSYTTNAFYKFNLYATKVAKISLPTGITELPTHSLLRLGEENANNYKLVHPEVTEEEYTELEAEISANMTAIQRTYNGSYYPINELVIPDNIVTLGWECCRQSVIQSIVLGTGVEEVQGGAFKLNYLLDNIDCKTGIKNCRLGDQAFQECNYLKHVVLSEGIISLGANCFDNSQHIESIRLPETLTAIGNSCFKNGHALSSITIPATVHQIGMSAFELTALTDIYLMAESIDDVPIIYTAGSDWGDPKSTFSKNTMEGNNTLRWDENANFGDGSTLAGLTFDEACEKYYTFANGMAALHFSPKVADVVLAEISSSYGYTSSDNYGIPIMKTDDSGKRGNAMNLQNMGGTGQNGGIYTKYGWAQFLLQKEFNPEHPEVFTKEYDDVWNTMCFPFDLTDEQLAAAFNEGFNIVDFSGVEIQDETQSSDGKLTLILHFNTVANTIYKDDEGNVYTNIGSEMDGKYKYNIYQATNGDVYHHVITATGSASGLKMKTFAKDGDASNGVVMIDGILASAGHPYMVHPNTGVNTGMPLTRCNFAGIKWIVSDDETVKTTDQVRKELFESQARTIDLTEARGNLNDGTPDADNYLQAAYSNYSGTYTFIGNHMLYSANAPLDTKPTVGTGENDLHELPLVTDYTNLYPNGPQLDPTAAAAKQAVIDAVGPKMTTAPVDPSLNPVDNPADDTDTYPAKFQTFYNTQAGHPYNKPWGEAILGCAFSDVAGGPYNWGGWVYQFLNGADNAFGTYFHGSQISNIPVEEFDETKFNNLKTLCAQYYAALSRYNEYQTRLANYPNDLAAYQANQTAWQQYETDYAQQEADYAEAMQTYLQALGNWQTACATVKAQNEAKLAAWEASMAKYQRLIPKGAYFLGRQGRGWPKYYREIAEEDRENPTGGFWTQYTAIIIPDAAAIAGIEAELDGTSSQGANQSVEMVFDEAFTGGDFVTTDEIEQIITEAESEGQKVQYMQVVYNINGQIVREGTSIDGLPKGIYIVNGKKYFVK